MKTFILFLTCISIVFSQNQNKGIKRYSTYPIYTYFIQTNDTNSDYYRLVKQTYIMGTLTDEMGLQLNIGSFKKCVMFANNSIGLIVAEKDLKVKYPYVTQNLIRVDNEYITGYYIFIHKDLTNIYVKIKEFLDGTRKY